ncbi:MAG: prolipoprotein diacylglyceryl transferase [Clostridia bacterium]|nr:prolipoprotein diacylglyceryl transferase [Clostridia bacterium]
MLPYINIGSFKLSTYYTAMFLGYVVMVVLMMLPARRRIYSISKIKAFLFATAVLVVGILGCKLLYTIENFDIVLRDGFTFGGFSFYGAAFLVPLIMPLFGLLLKMNVFDTLDNSAVNVLGMLGTIRIGCMLNGCCGGTSFHINHFTLTWPTQLLEAVFDFGILAWLLVLETRSDRYYRGGLYPRFMISYGIIRFIIEFMRDTPKDWLWLSHGQWFAIVGIAVGIGLLIIVKRFGHVYKAEK